MKLKACVRIAQNNIVFFKEKKMSKIIINADDYGTPYAKKRTDIISEYIIKGTIDRGTALLTVGDPEALSFFCRDKNIMKHVGLHVAINFGKAFSNEMKNDKRFTDKDGFFKTKEYLKKHFYHIPKKDQLIFYAEIDSQMKRYKELGFTNMHFDSHGHTHLFPALYKIYARAGKANGFSSIRGPVLTKNPLRHFYNKFFIKRYFEKRFAQVSTCVAFPNLNRKTVKKYKNIELMVHLSKYDDIVYDADIIFSEELNFVENI